MILANAKLYYPSAREWMWDYCVYLGPYTDGDNRNYDLGIHIDTHGDVSAAIVDGNEPGDYYSGNLSGEYGIYKEIYQETVRRAKELQLM